MQLKLTKKKKEWFFVSFVFKEYRLNDIIKNGCINFNSIASVSKLNLYNINDLYHMEHKNLGQNNVARKRDKKREEESRCGY